MKEERIVVRIGVDGQINAETIGIKGAKCLDVIGLLEELLEAQTVSSAFTAEYRQNELNTRIEGRNEQRH